MPLLACIAAYSTNAFSFSFNKYGHIRISIQEIAKPYFSDPHVNVKITPSKNEKTLPLRCSNYSGFPGIFLYPGYTYQKIPVHKYYGLYAPCSYTVSFSGYYYQKENQKKKKTFRVACTKVKPGDSVGVIMKKSQLICQKK